MHRLIITPEFHHWHHTNERDAIWTNYSTFLPFWDQLFGTYFMPKDRRPQSYGVNEPIPDGILRQLRHPFKGWRNRCGHVLHPFQSIRAFVEVHKESPPFDAQVHVSAPWDETMGRLSSRRSPFCPVMDAVKRGGPSRELLVLEPLCS